MTSSNAHDGISDAEVTALEALWRAAAAAPPERFLAQCLAITQAELAADRRRRATVRFYLTAAAVLLVGWHVSLLAASSLRSRAERSDVVSPTAFVDYRRALLDELTAELALDDGAGHSPSDAVPRAPLRAKARH
jgi:hypothetical protein